MKLQDEKLGLISLLIKFTILTSIFILLNLGPVCSDYYRTLFEDKKVADTEIDEFLTPDVEIFCPKLTEETKEKNGRVINNR